MKKQKSTEELLTILIIVELAKEGVSQQDIQRIVGVDIVKVNKIARYFKKKK